MKISIIKLSLAALFISAAFVSCKKDEETTVAEETTSPTPAASGAFTWQENGGATLTADSAFWTTGAWGTGVRAFKGGFSNFFEINWDIQNNTGVGSKSIGINGLTFLKGSDTYNNPAIQSLNVTAFSANQLSGNFNIAVSGGGTITGLSGSFTSLPLK